MISLDTKNEIARLRALDYSYNKIATALEVSKPKIIEICSELGTEVAELRRDQQDLQIEEFKFTSQERSKLYRQLIGKVHEEILSRDITAIPTERLFTVLERLERSIANVEPRLNHYDSQLAYDFEQMNDEELTKIANAARVPLVSNI